MPMPMAMPSMSMWGQPPAPAMAMAMPMSGPVQAMAMPGQPTYLGMSIAERARAITERVRAKLEQWKQMKSYLDQRQKNMMQERELDDDEWFRQQRPLVGPCFCDPCRRYYCSMKQKLPTRRLKFEEDKRVFETKKRKLEDGKNAMEVKKKQLLEEWKAEEHFQGILQNVIAVYMRRFEEFDQANNPDVPPIEGCPNSKGKGNDLIQ